ncbi:EscJ/YscJ/HrcJ family type III secretion inner membrane ring protein [Candidatus Aerophobetes bacterium]|uniref:EscJ/YscJ/HrcJ family type III secretion inner membrane ring protein n=1 Tax=Aerophobetes bacterium TaxID=2030807 RepID=A0A2A4WZ70_UNCAE|nr:MAG: EscJ/YscJ/HrcJ family type III secretion inner membrane ring protein [Candidatus Aerophobetes bacterium]
MTSQETPMGKQLHTSWLKALTLPLFIICALLFTSCATNKEIISGISEKEANIILVLLESKGIPASKEAAVSGGMASDSAPKYGIAVPEKNTILAISYLNQNGFPKEKGISLLELFSKQSLMTSEREETIRYQAGLAQQLNNTIMMIDGVIDSSVQLSFPPTDDNTLGEKKEGKITAAVYVKHQAAIDDPNAHLENKIKRLISGSITGLDLNDVTVVSDRSRFTDLSPSDSLLGSIEHPSEYVSIWSIVMSKESAAKFRFLFFFLMSTVLVLAASLGWLIWKCYPHLKRSGGLKDLFSPIPWLKKNSSNMTGGDQPNEK